MIDVDEAIDSLHWAYSLLVTASQAVQIEDPQLGRVNPPLAFVIGGLADAVFAVSDMLEDERDH